LNNTLIGVNTHANVADLNDIDNPVNGLERAIISNLALTLEGMMTFELHLQQNELQLDDSLIGVWSQPEQISFTNIKDDGVGYSLHKYSSNDQPIHQLLIAFRDGQLIEQLKRKVFNIFELFGILGGLFEIFDVAFGFLIGIISHKFFKNELKTEIGKAQKQYDDLKVMINNLENKLKQNSDNQRNQNFNSPDRENDYQAIRMPIEESKNQQIEELKGLENHDDINLQKVPM
jgi:hypothetical protein